MTKKQASFALTWAFTCFVTAGGQCQCIYHLSYGVYIYHPPPRPDSHIPGPWGGVSINPRSSSVESLFQGWTLQWWHLYSSFNPDYFFIGQVTYIAHFLHWWFFVFVLLRFTLFWLVHYVVRFNLSVVTNTTESVVFSCRLFSSWRVCLIAIILQFRFVVIQWISRKYVLDADLNSWEVGLWSNLLELISVGRNTE